MKWFSKALKYLKEKRVSRKKAPHKPIEIDRVTTMMARYSGSCLSQSQMARDSWNESDNEYYKRKKK